METTTVSWNEIVTALLALYGAVLSTIIFFKEQRKGMRRINLTLRYGFLTYDEGLSNQMLIFEVINPGFKAVTINGPQLRFADGKSMIFPVPNSNVRFPYTVEEGKSAHTWIELQTLIDSLRRNGYSNSVKFKGVVHDQTGREFATKKWMKLDLTRNYG